jgi:hypothetical protein
MGGTISRDRSSLKDNHQHWKDESSLWGADLEGKSVLVGAMYLGYVAVSALQVCDDEVMAKMRWWERRMWRLRE